MAFNRDKYVTSAEDCWKDIALETPPSGFFCNATWDTIMCWPQTPSGSVARQPCPAIFGAPNQSYAYKTCGLNGIWTQSSKWYGFGHSNYSECLKHRLPIIDYLFHVSLDKDKVTMTEASAIVNVKSVNNLKEYVFTFALLSSLIALLVSHVCMSSSMSKKLNQALTNTIWKHFLYAVMAETVARLVQKVVYLLSIHSVFNTSHFLCSVLVVMLEFADISTFMWFLIQTSHSQLTVRCEQLNTFGYVTYILIGWGIPLIPTVVWSVSSSLSFKVHCWNGYQFQPIFWIVQAPKILMILTTLKFIFCAFSEISKNSVLPQTSCCYRRLFLETVGSVLYFVFMVSLVSAVAVQFALAANSGVGTLEVLCSVLVALKGVVLSAVLCIFNTDIRELVALKVKSLSRQETVLDEIRENQIREYHF